MTPVKYQVPVDQTGHIAQAPPKFVEVLVWNVPRIGDRIDVDGAEFEVHSVLWADLECSKVLVILR